jgi:AAA+ superfamily predicted ATPase
MAAEARVEEIVLPAGDNAGSTSNLLNLERDDSNYRDDDDDDGDDATSVSSSLDSFEEVRPRHRSSRPRPPRSRYSSSSPPAHRLHTTYQPMPLVDGKAPDVLYVLEYYNRHNQLVEERLSTAPFEHLPEDLGRQKRKRGEIARRDDEDASNRGEPVLEVVRTVDGTKHYRGPPRVSRRNRDSRPVDTPVTHNFSAGGYYASDAYTDDEDDISTRSSSFDLSPPTLFVMSKHLINAISAVVRYYPGLSLTSGSLEVKSPYRFLYHHREQLAHYRDHQPDSHTPECVATTKEHIDTLLRFLAEDRCGLAVAKEEERHRLSVPLATYQQFWQLLKPGTIVYAKTADIWEAFVVSRVEGEGTNSTYSVVCWYLESNGNEINRFMTSFTVARWLGAQPISSLPVVPQVYWQEDLDAQNGINMRETLIKQGKLYWDLLKRPTYMDYEGQLVNSPGGGAPAASITGFMSGRVVCDAAGFIKYFNSSPCNRRRHGLPPPPPRRSIPYPSRDPLPLYSPRCPCEACSLAGACFDGNRPVDGPFSGFEGVDPIKDTAPTDDLFYLLCKKTMPGFMLSHRSWGHLRLSALRPVNSDKDAFKYLVLDEEIKRTARALIGKYATSSDGSVSPWGNDFVKNKGEGRIFLLHGSPGVGKTCTAECIAELTSRPLLSLTSGDLGVNDDMIDERLSYFLELGQRYGALVLLDEADVYLERRRGSDIWRNGLVSIFLRALEYYRGVLFLTTNRVRSFDPAFLSRIHVALHYKSLRDEDRERIWLNNFERLERESAGKVHVSAAARELVWGSGDVRHLQWNGREIRNAMQTALGLAEFDAEGEASDTIIIGEKHIQAVVKMSRDFRDFVNKDDADGVRGFALRGQPMPYHFD